jgi:hypothetical protein
MQQEPFILTALAICSVICGPVLVAARSRNYIRSFVPRHLAGSVFVFGFVLLGIAISHWRFDNLSGAGRPTNIVANDIGTPASRHALSPWLPNHVPDAMRSDLAPASGPEEADLGPEVGDVQVQ